MRTWKISILVFALSLCLASVGMAAKARSATQRLVDQLTLTPDQKVKLDPILDEDASKLRAIRADATMSADDKKVKSAEIRKDTEAKLKGILTGDQWKQYKDLKAERSKKKKS